MEQKILFMRPVLERLGQGAFYCRAAAIVLRTLAGVVILFSAITFFSVGRTVFELPASSILGGVLFELFFVVAVYAVVHAILIRARDVANLRHGEFYALPVGALVVRLLGECYAAFVSLVAVGTGLFVWFTNFSIGKVLTTGLRALFPVLRVDPNFMGGIEFIVGGLLAAAVAIIAAYTLAELLTLLGRLVKNGHGTNPNTGVHSRFGTS